MNNQQRPTELIAEKKSRYLTTLVAGINFRKADAINFANGTNQSLSFLREFDNKFDKHAIKIIGKASGMDYFIGYVPKEISNQIVRTKLENILYPEVDRVYISSGNFVEVRFNIVGPTSFRAKFRNWADKKPLNQEQKDFFKFFGLSVPLGLKNKEIQIFILSYLKNLRIENPYLEKQYDCYLGLFEEFQDKFFRDDNGIKKPTRKELSDAIDKLILRGNSYELLYNNLEMLIEQIKLQNPFLAR